MSSDQPTPEPPEDSRPPTPAASRDPGKNPPEPAELDGDTHDVTGLDTARAMVSAMRGLGSKVRFRAPRRRATRIGAFSGAHPDWRDPAPVGASVERIVAEAGWATEIAVHGVFARWSDVVGEEVAAHCTPETYQDAHLSIRTDSSAWATQLKLLAPNLVRRLNEELGDGTVVRIDVKPPDAPSWRRGRRSVRGARGPRDTYG